MVKVGILGLGTVGSGTVNILNKNKSQIQSRTGCEISIVAVSAQDPNKARNCDLEDISFFQDPFEVLEQDIDVVIEVIGGMDISKKLILAAIDKGIHVITANKALIALEGNELFQKAKANDCIIAFEAAVAGGIPIIKTLREGLGANKIEWLAGIINGTSNYVLTLMRDQGFTFEHALARAQEKGYAEQDPTFDVGGIDAAHKLAIMSSIAFGMPLKYENVTIEGIEDITLSDIQIGKELGYELKHLGIARDTDRGVELRVHPTFVPEGCLLAHVEGVMNAIFIQSNAVGPTFYYGQGAGSDATASSIVADLIDIIRDLNSHSSYRVPYLAFHQANEKAILTDGDIETSFYLRIMTQDIPGVLAQMTQILSDNHISIETLIQQKDFNNENEMVPIVIITHQAIEGNMKKALKAIEKLKPVKTPVRWIRLEKIDTKGTTEHE